MGSAACAASSASTAVSEARMGLRTLYLPRPCCEVFSESLSISEAYFTPNCSIRGSRSRPADDQRRRSGGMVRGPDGSNRLLHAGHCSSRLLAGAIKTSNACAFISTDAPRYATDTMRPPLGVSSTSRREWQFGQRTFAGSVDADEVATAEIVAANSEIAESVGDFFLDVRWQRCHIRRPGMTTICTCQHHHRHAFHDEHATHVLTLGTLNRKGTVGVGHRASRS